MAADKVDRRIRRTEQLLGDALIALASEKGYDQVTIRDITERADVAYITFFRHYQDKHDLLMQRVKQVAAELETIAHRAVVEDTPAYHEMEGRLIFQYVQEHPDFYYLVTNNAARSTIRVALAAGIQRHLDNHGWVIPTSLAAHHCAVSLLGMIEWWFENDKPYSVERMAEIYYQIIVQPVLMTSKE